VVSHIASLDRSDILGDRCVVVACDFGAGDGLAAVCYVVLRFAGGDSRRRRPDRTAAPPAMAWMERGCPDCRRRARALVLVPGGWRLLGVLGIANGAAVVFLFVLASLTILR
jgi:hypothetical protein